MPSKAVGGHYWLRIGYGCVVALLALFASAEISHQYFASHPAIFPPVGEVLAVVVLLSLAIGLSWMSPFTAVSAGVTLLAGVVIDQIAWGPLYFDVDPMGLDPKEMLAFASQQLTSAALLPALFLPGLLRWFTVRSSAARSPVGDGDAAVTAVGPPSR